MIKNPKDFLNDITVGDVLKIDLSRITDDTIKTKGIVVAVVVTKTEEITWLDIDCIGLHYKPFNENSTGYIINYLTDKRDLAKIDLSKLKNANPETVYKMLEHTDDDSFWLAQQILKNEGLL